jgi:hypothetical protein
MDITYIRMSRGCVYLARLVSRRCRFMAAVDHEHGRKGRPSATYVLTLLHAFHHLCPPALRTAHQTKASDPDLDCQNVMHGIAASSSHRRGHSIIMLMGGSS